MSETLPVRDEMNAAKPPRGRVWLRRIVMVMAGMVVYVVTAVPFGMMVYTIKTQSGIDVFKRGGWHSYLSCVQHELNVETGKTPLPYE